MKQASKASFNVRIARTKLGELIIIDSDEDWYADDSGFSFADDILDARVIHDYVELVGQELVPEERGVYECEVEVDHWQSNHPLDPVEYDMSVGIVGVKRLI